MKPALALIFLLTAATLLGAPSPAETAIARAQDQIARHPDHAPYHAALAMAYARRARETSDVEYYARAEKAVDRALELQPDSFEALKARTWLELGRHEFAKALASATKLNRRTPDDLIVYGYLVDANAELGNYDAAVAAAQWMLDLRPGNVPALTRSAYLRELHGDLDGAAELMRLAYDATPFQESEDRAWLLTQLAHLAWVGGDLAAAEKQASAALAAFPDYHYALGALARVRLAQKRYAESAVLLRKRYDAAPHPENLYPLAEALELAGQTDAAARAFAEFEKTARAECAIADNSNHELIAFYLDHQRQPGEALRLAREEVQRRQDAYTLDALARALEANGQHEEALKTIERSLSWGIRTPQILAHAAAIRQQGTQCCAR